MKTQTTLFGHMLKNDRIRLTLKEKLLGKIAIKADLADFLTNVRFVFPDQELMDNMKRGMLYSWGNADYGCLAPKTEFIVKLTQSPDHFLTTRNPLPGDEDVLAIISTDMIMKWLVTETVTIDDLVMESQFPPMNFEEN